MNQDSFRFRPYTKRELARLYFPKTTDPKVAVANLRNWINRSDELMSQLTACGYTPHNIWLTPKQVRLIVEFLGEP